MCDAWRGTTGGRDDARGWEGVLALDKAHAGRWTAEVEATGVVLEGSAEADDNMVDVEGSGGEGSGG